MNTKMLAAAALSAALLSPAAPARADTVTEWNFNASNALFVTAAQPPQASVPHLAMVHGAVYRAPSTVNRRPPRGRTCSPGPRSAGFRASKEAAAATAAYRRAREHRAGTAGANWTGCCAAPRWPALPDGAGESGSGIGVGEAGGVGDDRGADERRPLRRRPASPSGSCRGNGARCCRRSRTTRPAGCGT